METSFEQARAAMIDRLVEEFDPRNHVASRAFLALVRPEVANPAAEVLNEVNRLRFEMALDLFDMRHRYEELLPSEEAWGLGDGRDQFLNACHEMLLSIDAMNTRRFAEMHEQLAALRVHTDESWFIDLQSAAWRQAIALTEDEGYEQAMEPEIQRAIGKGTDNG